MNNKCAKGIQILENQKGVSMMEILSHANLSQYYTMETASHSPTNAKFHIKNWNW